jgi:type I restriction enzyme S subunit
MSGWEQKIFSELGVCIRGVSYKPEDLRPDFSEKSIALLRSNNIKNGRLWFHDLQFVDQAVVRDNQKLQNHDIAICMSNGNRALVGKSGQFIGDGDNVEYTVGAFCSIFRPATGFNATYIRYLFGSGDYQRQLDGILVGSAINNLRASDIHGLTADCPISVPEQTQIAAILSTLDKAIEQTEALIAKQQRIKTGLMQDLLTKGIDENGNIRSEATHEFKDSPLGRIPVEWINIKVREAGEVTLGRQLSPKYMSGNNPAPYLRVANVFDGWIDYSGVLEMDFSDKERDKFFLKPGDILLNEGQSIELVGRSAIFWGPEDTFCFQNTLIRFRVFDSAHPNYCQAVFKWWLDSGRFQDVARQTTSVAHLGADRFASMPFPLPSFEEQIRISETFERHKVFNELANRELDKLNSLKRGLMHDLLTGKVRVTELPNPEQP